MTFFDMSFSNDEERACDEEEENSSDEELTPETGTPFYLFALQNTVRGHINSGQVPVKDLYLSDVETHHSSLNQNECKKLAVMNLTQNLSHAVTAEEIYSIEDEDIFHDDDDIDGLKLVTELLRRRNYKVISILEADMEPYLQNLKLMTGILWWSENHWVVLRQSQDKEWIFHDSCLGDVLVVKSRIIRQFLICPPPEDSLFIVCRTNPLQ